MSDALTAERREVLRGSAFAAEMYDSDVVLKAVELLTLLDAADEVATLRAEVERAIAEVSYELTEAHLALENFAGVYDAFLAAKGVAWCRHWESVPLHQLFSRDGVQFRMPTLEDCRRAKAAVEGETTMPAPPKGEQQS